MFLASKMNFATMYIGIKWNNLYSYYYKQKKKKELACTSLFLNITHTCVLGNGGWRPAALQRQGQTKELPYM